MTTQTEAEVRSPFDLHGRCAVVTGAGRGLGQAVALGLAQAGADLVLLGRPGSQDGTRDQVVATWAATWRSSTSTSATRRRRARRRPSWPATGRSTSW